MLHAALVLVLAPQQAAPSTDPARDWPTAFGVDVDLAAGEVLLGYAWRGGWPVPSASNDRRVRIEFGERGLTPGARLYLPGHSPLEARAAESHVVEEHALELVDGRFGRALGFRADSRLRVALARPGGESWTLSFWIRPGPLVAGFRGAPLVRLAGAAEVALERDGRVRAELLPAGERVTHPVPLASDKWSYVALAYDPEHLEQLRLFAAESSVHAALASGSPPRIATELLAGDVGAAGSGFRGALDELALEPGAASTEECLMIARAPAPRGPQHVEILTTRGRRALEPAAGATRELVLDRPEELAQGALVRAVVADGVLRWASAHWSALDVGPAPLPRTTHPLVGLGDRRLFTFGGETRDSHLWPMRNTDDTWIFDGARNRWTEIRGGPAPSPRCHVPAAYSPDHGVVLLVGGVRFDVDPPQLNGETWLYHVATARWERRFPGGDALGNASDHGLVYLPALRRFLLLRNERNWLYDPVADVWQQLPRASAVTPAGQPASYSIGGSTMCVLDERSGLVVTFGGSYGPQQDVFSDTTALYDPVANRYVVLDPPVRPSPRVRGAYGYDPRRGHVVLFGGVQGQFSQRHDDLWVFDPRALTWRELECSNRPPRCGGYYGFGHDPVADRFVLFSGRGAPDRWLSRTWALELDERRPGTATYTFDRLEQPGRTRFFADATTPGDSHVVYAARTSDSGATWSPWRRAETVVPRQRLVQVAVRLVPGSRGEVPSVARLGWR